MAKVENATDHAKGQSNKNILVSGGAGYIGATVCSALLDAGWRPIILDNLSTGRRQFTEGRLFYEGDIADRGLIARIVKEQGPLFGAIHCAALIIVPESVAKPEEYYRENVSKSVELFSALRDQGCRRIVFSSSAAIYDGADGFMVTETSSVRPFSPYARTKAMMEMVLQDFCAAYDMRGIALRYFNPIGADPKMRTGPYVENPSHLLGRLIVAADSDSEPFQIMGTDWPTRDGSGIRDFIHVWDLARAHVNAMTKFDGAFLKPGAEGSSNYRVINLGTGQGVTVKEFVTAFEKVNGSPVQKREAPRRPGDLAGCFASAATAEALIGWKAELSVEQGIRDALTWTRKFRG